jgi:dihydrofolate reductase
MKIAAIVAMNEARLIGREGQLPWHIPEDLKRFKKLTMGSPVIMGRKTYESLPAVARPLPGRLNIIITRNKDFKAPTGVIVVDSPTSAINAAKIADSPTGTAWVIGGAEIYKALLPHIDEIALTSVPGKDVGDAYFPEFEESFDLVQNEAGSGCSFLYYRRIQKTRS